MGKIIGDGFDGDEEEFLKGKFEETNTKVSNVWEHVSTCKNELRNEVLNPQHLVLCGKLDETLNTLRELKEAGNVLLDQETLNKRVEDLEEIKKLFENEQESLKKVIAEFKKAIDEHVQAKEALAKEKLAVAEKLAKEACQGFSEEEEKLATMLHFKKMLDKYHDMLRERASEAIVAFGESRKKLDEDFNQRLKEMEKEFSLQSDTLRTRENELDKRTAQLLADEKKLKDWEMRLENGLVDERQKQKSALASQRNDIAQEWQKLEKAQSDLEKEREQLNAENAALVNQKRDIERREREAENGFVKEREKALKGLSELEKNCRASIRQAELEAQKKANADFEEHVQLLKEQRENDLESFRTELKRRREEDEADRQARKQKQDAEAERLKNWEESLGAQADSIAKRECAVRQEEERQKQKREADEETLRSGLAAARQVANSRIEAAEWKIKAVESANADLKRSLDEAYMQLAEQQIINARFGSRSADDIYAELSRLEQRIKELQKEKLDLQGKLNMLS